MSAHSIPSHPQRSSNPLAPFLAEQGYVVIDGALATELERQGADLDDDLWSAKLLIEDPDLVKRVHTAYLQRRCRRDRHGLLSSYDRGLCGARTVVVSLPRTCCGLA